MSRLPEIRVTHWLPDGKLPLTEAEHVERLSRGGWVRTPKDRKLVEEMARLWASLEESIAKYTEWVRAYRELASMKDGWRQDGR
jgi:hypothetical protein